MADKEHFTKFIARWTACVGLGCQLRRDAEYRFRVWWLSRVEWWFFE